jgi:hypothetical protein
VTSASLALIVAAAVGLASSAAVCAAPAAAVAKASVSNVAGTKPTSQSKLKLQGNSQSALTLEGKSGFFGPFSMKIGKGLRIRAKFGFTIWAMNKPNDVYMLNAENRVYIPQTQEEWFSWSRRGVPNIDITETEVIDKPLVHGQPCVHYFGFQKIGNRRVKVAEFYCLQKSPCEPQVLEFWCKHFLIPAKYGFPVLVKQRVGKDMPIVLDTWNMRTIAGTDVDLQVPKDYKPTKDKAAFYFSNGGSLTQSDLEEFFQQPLK